MDTTKKGQKRTLEDVFKFYDLDLFLILFLFPSVSSFRFIRIVYITTTTHALNPLQNQNTTLPPNLFIYLFVRLMDHVFSLLIPSTLLPNPPKRLAQPTHTLSRTFEFPSFIISCFISFLVNVLVTFINSEYESMLHTTDRHSSSVIPPPRHLLLLIAMMVLLHSTFLMNKSFNAVCCCSSFLRGLPSTATAICIP